MVYKKEILFSYSSGNQKSKTKDMLSLKSLGKKASLPLPVSSGSKGSLACGHITLTSASIFTRTSSLCESVLTLIKTLLTGFKAHPGNLHQSLKIFNYITKMLFPNKVTFTDLGVRMWTYLSGGHNSSAIPPYHVKLLLYFWKLCSAKSFKIKSVLLHHFQILKHFVCL